MKEILDLYDSHRNFTGETMARGEPTPEGRWKLGVVVWVRDDRGRFLMSRRHPMKTHPLIWEPTGGGVRAGEDTRTAAVRELGEELSIQVAPDRLTLIDSRRLDERGKREFQDVYLTNWNGDAKALHLQEDEVCDAKWAEYSELDSLETQDFTREVYRSVFARVPNLPTAICPMRLEDYDEVYALWRGLPGMGLNDTDDSREGIERFLRRNPGMSFVARTAKGIMGCILCGHDGRRGHLYHAAVHPEMRGRGLGRALTNAAMDALRGEGISKAGLMVFADNAAGMGFWDGMDYDDRVDVRYRSRKL